MALQEKQLTEEQSQNQQTNQEELQKSLKEKVLNSDVQKNILSELGLSPQTEEEKPKKVLPKEEVEEVEEETQEDEEDQADESDDLEAEEVVSKSKVQKRMDELNNRIKIQERQLEELRNSKAQESKDEITKQLEAMTPAELKAAKLEVRKAQIKNQNDDSRLNELLALEDKIDNVMHEAPKNFAKAQTEAFNRAAQKIAESGEIKELEKASPAILKIANDIYQKHSSLQKDINGQATALELAFEHYKILNSASGDKTKEVELKRQVNNLKRKTTLDTKSGNANLDKSKLDTLKKNAMNGTLRQKIDLVRNHPMFNIDAMIPDEFKER